jgi:hypothetical protein
MMHCEGCASTVKRAVKRIPGDKKLSTSINFFMVHGITAFFCTLEKFPNCIWRTPYIHEHPEEGSYAYSLRVGEKLQCKIPPHSLLRSRCKNPPPPMPCYRQMFKFMIMLASCFTMGEAMGGRHAQNAGAGLSATA